MNQIASPHEPAIRDILLCRLALAPENMRKIPPHDTAQAQFQASIAEHELLENLVVRPDDGKAPVPKGPRPGVGAMFLVGRGDRDNRRRSLARCRKVRVRARRVNGVRGARRTETGCVRHGECTPIHLRHPPGSQAARFVVRYSVVSECRKDRPIR